MAIAPAEYIRAICSTSLLALSAAASVSTACAQEAQVPELQQAAKAEDIVVTGSRLGKTGFSTPTPVTVTTAETLKAAAPGNIADGLNQLPVFGGSTKANQSGGGSVSNGNNGQNLLNLRNLGANRVLVLLDGRRIVATNQAGSVDVNIIPQSLVSRVDVVTGGASAAYGSDAVAGVVNFVLDTKFEGVKGELTGGISTHGDAGSFNASAAFGKHFADDSVRFIASVEYARNNGIGVNDDTGRSWYERPSGQIPNPTTGATPSILVIGDIRSSVGTYGGLITASTGATTPLKNIEFLPGGVTASFVPGSPLGSTFMSGGSGAKVNNGLSPDAQRFSSFVHAEVDAAPGLTLFAEGGFSRSTSRHQAFVTQHVGGSGQFVIFSDNAFLPGSIKSQMPAGSRINVGRFFHEFPAVENENRTEVLRGSAGLSWHIADRWKFDASYTYGQTDQHLFQNNRTNLRNIYAAVDAVVDPASGKVVCRSTLAGLDPGCVPLNIFGEGSPSAAAISYVIGNSGKDLRMVQQVAQANIAGDLGDQIQLGAGPISLAAGVEYRTERANQVADAVSQQTLSFAGVRGFPSSLDGRLGVYQSNNPQPMSGKYNVTDLYAEIGVPVIDSFVLAKHLDVDAAIRRTKYSQSGVVTTWKMGANWQVVDGIRLRYTKSRDIRGPNILELYNSQTQVTQNVIYNGVSVQDLVITSGNPALAPEKALTETFGLVARPSFIPGLQFSVDRFNIKIDGAIGTITPLNTINLCAAGNTLLCSQITVTGPTTITIRQQTLNLNVARVAGYDFEAAYTAPLLSGSFRARLLATHLTKAETQAIGSAPLTTLRSPSTPLWRFAGTVSYNDANWNLVAQERVIGESLIDPLLVEGVGTSRNRIPAIAYTDLTIEKKLRMFGGKQSLFVTVNNLFDQAPPISGGNPTSFSLPADQAYDLIGRYISAGIRFQF